MASKDIFGVISEIEYREHSGICDFLESCKGHISFLVEGDIELGEVEWVTDQLVELGQLLGTVREE